MKLVGRVILIGVLVCSFSYLIILGSAVMVMEVIK